MLGEIIKRVLPHTLLGRALLIIVTPLILLQVISAFVFYERHWSWVSRQLTDNAVAEIVSVVELWRTAPDDVTRQRILAIGRQTFGLDVSFEDGAILPNTAHPIPVGDKNFASALAKRMQRPLVFGGDTSGTLPIDIQFPDGVLHVSISPKRLVTSTTYVFVLWMVGSSLVLFAVAMLFMRNQVRPIRRLALAADALGKGRDVPPFKLAGAIEVRQAAHAFNIMRERIRRQIGQRTEMLAGVSHDLRTPLTRMKLELAMLKGSAAEELKADVTEMEHMVEGYLAFARGDESEPTATADLGELIDEIATQARRAGAEVTVKDVPIGELTLAMRRAAMKRALSNLVVNATTYGTRADIAARRVGGNVEITVDDEGPGVPPERREDVFRPFFRLEESRNLETGGVGLGLSIARDVIHGHGGSILLEDSPLGGLRVRLRLPV
ncbi:MAG TPA: ATP-binding protein [Alphaproteobacteria bacterium]|nr:ATP-binding protein [Alphaproteobacteria bacterium]